MHYVDGFVVPVPKNKLEAYRGMAKKALTFPPPPDWPKQRQAQARRDSRLLLDHV